MRAAPNDVLNYYTPILAGGPLPLVGSFDCRFVPETQIEDITTPFTEYIGYVTFDPPNLLFAASVNLLGSGFATIDWWTSSPVELASDPGVMYYPSQIDHIVTATDDYYRAWLLPVVVVD